MSEGKILVVDDSATMRNLLTTLLKKEGFETHVASDGLEGLRVFSDTPPDLVIADINMPKMDGIRMISAIRSSQVAPKVPIVVLTTENSEESKEKMKEVGASAWISKPYDDPTIMSVIRQFMH